MKGIAVLVPGTDELWIDKRVKIPDNSEVFLDKFDFDNYSIEFFLQYLSFKEVSEYYFISRGNHRIEKIVEHLNSFTDNIIFYNIELNDNNLFKTDEFFLDDIIKNIRKVNNDFTPTSLINKKINGYYSGYFGIQSSNYTIYAISMNDQNLFNKLSESIIKNSTLNSIVVNMDKQEYKYLLSDSWNPFPKEVRVLDSMSIPELLDTFKNTGLIEFKSCTSILDFSVICHQKNLQRIHVTKNGIFLDLKEKIRLSKNIQEEFSTIINQFSFLEEFSDRIIDKYYLDYFNLSYHLGTSAYFVTPYNIFSSKKVYDENTIHDYIGIIIDDDCFIYNINKNMMVKVNKDILYLMEIYIKNDYSIYIDEAKVNQFSKFLKNLF
ncbi:hypothetical protein [Streptococcus orisasini]|uniref:hypothetical protein n=1 Tax=Streptococcus orisasini TaxID=1080071 RepID=UPI000A69727F|nr:hypothetical protein [Streptococcus orisasini]